MAVALQLLLALDDESGALARLKGDKASRVAVEARLSGSGRKASPLALPLPLWRLRDRRPGEPQEKYICGRLCEELPAGATSVLWVLSRIKS